MLDTQHVAAVTARIPDYRVRVGAVLAKGDRLLCAASNRVRNSAKNVPYGEATTHAEQACLNMDINSDKMTMYIARLNTFGHEMPSRPCIACMKEIRKKTSIKEIVYLDLYHSIVKERLEV
jgi:deoxycytidylate deaminase